MFIHESPVELPKQNVRTFYEDGLRFYDTENGKYPSITSILSANPEKKKSLARWRARVGDVEANRISKFASGRGTVVHKICENYLNNEGEAIKGEMPDAIEMFNTLKPILDESLDKIYAQEVALWSDRFQVAGRVDCIAEWDGVPVVLDFKTSSKPKRKEWVEDYFIQCAAYAAMFYEMTGIPIKDMVIAIMVEGTEPQIFKEKVGPWILQLDRRIKQFNEIYKNNN